VILVGHSYGGLIITGAADRCVDRIRALVYFDAFVPERSEQAIF
jgi:pimeloyl-ACP methyl ester carboxylesterase